jgi:hypothetical protein
MEDLNVVIRGNGLDKNGLAHFNLTCSSLKGEAAEQEEETRDTHIKCLHAITEQECSPRTIRYLNRKLICATTCSFT